jgi:hypothetical protein
MTVSSLCFPVPDMAYTALVTSMISHMGLLPEIERAWISYDHKLFLWDYVDGCVLIYKSSVVTAEPDPLVTK